MSELHVVQPCWDSGAPEATRLDRQTESESKQSAHWLQCLERTQLMGVGGNNGCDVTWSDVSV